MLTKLLTDKAAETCIETLLLCMQANLAMNPNYRKHIENFSASYVFMSQDKNITVNVRFEKGEMSVRKKIDENANIFIKFKDGKALINFLLKGGNILQGLLKNEVAVQGNLNYMYKFAFMVKQLELSVIQRFHGSPNTFHHKANPWENEDLNKIGKFWASVASTAWLLSLRGIAGNDIF